MIAFSAVPRTIQGRHTWAVLVTTTEATHTDDSVTICPRKDADRSVIVSEVVRAALSVGGSVYIDQITEEERAMIDAQGLKLEEAIPPGAATFLQLASARGSK